MSIRFSVDVSDIFPLAADLANAADVIAGGAARAVNDTTDYVHKETVSRITSKVNLRPEYVEDHLFVMERATPESTKAVIVAPVRGVFVDRYSGIQKSQANVWTAAMYREKFGGLDTLKVPKFGAPLLPWTPRTGDNFRGRNIPIGKKAAGVQVRILAGGAVKTIATAFFLPLREGTTLGEGRGAFRRPEGGGEPKALKSISVDQMSRLVWRQSETEFAEILRNEVLDAVADDIEKELKI